MVSADQRQRDVGKADERVLTALASFLASMLGAWIGWPYVAVAAAWLLVVVVLATRTYWKAGYSWF